MIAELPRNGLAVGMWVLIVCLAAPVWADEDQPEIDAPAPDREFGEHPLLEDAYFDEPQRFRGRADRRHELNSLAGRAIAWPTGYIAPAGTLTYSNQLLVGHRLALSVHDAFELSGYAFLPRGSQSFAGGGAQLRVLEGDAWGLTTGVTGRYRRTNFEPGTVDAATSVHAVFDVIASDNTTWNAGITAQIPIYLAVEEVDFSDCETRRQWAEGACGATASRSGWMPASGHWVSLHAGVNHFVNDWMLVNVEAFSGVSQANFWALESALDRELTYSRELELVEDTEWRAGLGPLGIVNLGLGATFRVGPVTLQPAVFLTNYDGDARVFPFLTIAPSRGLFQ